MTMPTEDYVRNARLVRVIDADTLVVNVDLGDHTWREREIRLARVNAPERRTPAGTDAILFVSSILAFDLVVQTFRNPDDKYGRMLAEVWVRDSGTNLADALLANGHATLYKSR